jgi:hypothetical protein
MENPKSVLVSSHVTAELYGRVLKSATANCRTIAQELRHLLARTYSSKAQIELR